jgi:hydroxymethylpyrimidine pyrophosphatase-like HAD family hydrolase
VALAATGDPLLLVPNLLNDLSALGALLTEAVRVESWIDAYLIAAAMNQIAEDTLHAAPYPLDEAASFWRTSPSRPTRLAADATSICGRSARALAGTRPSVRRLCTWQRQLDKTVENLADVVAGTTTPNPGLKARCHTAADQISSLPTAARSTVLSLPACFHGFDQRPEDLDRLAERYCNLAPGAGRPMLVVGVRTSGSYLAPLLAAFLRARGHPAARAITLRPRHALLAQERALVSATARAGGDVLVTDDPPVTGASLAQAAETLERSGVAPERIVMAIGLMQKSPPASAIERYRMVSLAPGEWTVDPWFRRDAVCAMLGSLLTGELEVEAVEPRALPSSPLDRGHRRSLWHVRGRDSDTGAARELDVLVAGVGLAYLGGQALEVASKLSAFSPRVLGLRQGLLYREWLASETRVGRSESISGEFAAAAARYVAARRDVLPLAGDPSMGLRGARPAWEVAGLILSGQFGRGSPIARVVFVDAIARRLLTVARPSVVDGTTEVERWFVSESVEAPFLKAGLSDRTHGRLGLACFDAAFDLAGVGALSPDGCVSDGVRCAWRELTGEDVSPERWLLYELIHAWGAQREDPRTEADVRQAAARALQRYFATVFLAGVESPLDGPLVALDVDGVLETELLGWSSLTRASATVLRALLEHGYRPVPVSGRGLDEIRDRCRAYSLDGGVAEYGAALYVTEGDRTIPLVERRQATALDRLRAVLTDESDIRLDPVYRHSLRAYRIGREGRRRPLSQDATASALTRASAVGMVRAIQGVSQTDFIPSAANKGSGIEALSTELGGQRCGIALAVGDSLPDGPFLRLARTAFVPAHAPAGIGNAAVKRAARPYQAGLALAVADLLGHAPGECPRCRPLERGPEQSTVVGLLSIGEGGRRSIPRQTAGLLAQLAMAGARGRLAN